MIARRSVLRLIGAGAVVAGSGVLMPAGVFAATEDQAKKVVRQAVDEVLALVTQPGASTEKAPKLRGIMEQYAAMPQIARFAAGPVWRQMSDSQQAAYVDAFSDYISRVYARRFQEYSGQTVSIDRAIDAGKKGILVESSVSQPQGAPVPVSWLVSDRAGGEPRIVDIIIEGVSLATTQRDEVGALYDRNAGNADKLIDALKSS